MSIESIVVDAYEVDSELSLALNLFLNQSAL